MSKPEEWDDTPIAEQVYTCPVCGDAYLEVGPVKSHFTTEHGVRYDESLLSEDDLKRHLENK